MASFAKLPQMILKESRHVWKYTDFRQLSGIRQNSMKMSANVHRMSFLFPGGWSKKQPWPHAAPRRVVEEELRHLRALPAAGLADDEERGPKLKGSIGEGSNHSNFSHQSSVKILGIQRKPRKAPLRKKPLQRSGIRPKNLSKFRNFR